MDSQSVSICCLRAKDTGNKLPAILASCIPAGETKNKHREKELMKILKSDNARKK